jgi:two-component system OmpR family response regulator
VSNYLILVADDDRCIQSLLVEALEKVGFRTLSAIDGEEALERFESSKPDCVVLDVMMPRLDGIEVCRRIRSTSDTPVIMLTSLDEETDKIVGLELGADDYITKPFSPREVVARIKAVMRRFKAAGKAKEVEKKKEISAGDLIVDTEGCQVTIKGHTVTLTATEYKILEVLIRHPGKVLSRSQIAEMAYGNAFEGFDRTIDAHIKNIRQKFAAFVPEHDHIQTSRGLGYKFVINLL